MDEVRNTISSVYYLRVCVAEIQNWPYFMEFRACDCAGRGDCDAGRAPRG
jgi:hypothetical protein